MIKKTTHFYLSLLLLAFANTLLAQDVSCPCLEDDCGDILSSFAILGEEAIVCDGFEFTVSNSTATNDFDFFLWSWGDGTFDTTFTKENVSHTYFIPDSLVCEDDKTNFEICLVVVRNCGTDLSCHSTSQPVGVIHRPLAFFEADPQICIDDDTGIQNASCNADTFFWDFGDGNTSTEENPNHTFAGPGFYTVTLTVENECDSDTYTQIIEVVEQPAAEIGQSSMMGSVDSLCAPAVVTFTNDMQQSATFGQWAITPNDTSLWAFTDTTMTTFSDTIEIQFWQPGEYTVELTASNICGTDTQTEEITIYQQPFINLVPPPVACDSAVIDLQALAYEAIGDLDGFEWTFTNGSQPGASEEDFGQVTFYESGTVTLQAGGPCGLLTETVPVAVVATEAITFGANPDVVCQNADSIQLQASPGFPAGLWSGAGSALSPSGMLYPDSLAPGDYTFTYTVGQGSACENSEALELTIDAPVQVELTAADPACGSFDFSPEVSYQGSGLTYNWSFPGGNPGSSTDSLPGPIVYGQPDTTQIIVQVAGNCGADADTIQIVVQEPQEVEAFPVTEPLCSGSSPDTLSANVSGGIWLGAGIINDSLGVFDPATVDPGLYEIIYQLANGACVDEDTIQLEVVASEEVLLQADTFCVDSPGATLQANPGGGQWQSGAALSADGFFDPAFAEIGPNPATYEYVDANNCRILSTVQVLVEDLPALSLSPLDTFCLSDIPVNLPDALLFSAEPGGGTAVWSGPGVTDDAGTLVAETLSPGLYTLQVEYQRNACRVTDSTQIWIAEAPALQLAADSAVCISEGVLQLGTNLPGGQWSGPGVDAESGLIDLPVAGGGTFEYAYLYEAGTNCEQSGTIDVEIIDLSAAVEAGAPEAICEGPATWQLSAGSPANGSWSGPGITDSLGGIINLGLIPRDTALQYQYCIESEAVDACRACDTRSFTLYANPAADFAFDGLPCVGEDFQLIDASEGAVSYAWDFGDGSASTLPSPGHSYDTPGTYELSLQVTSADGCPDTKDTTLYITTPPVADFELLADEGCAPFELQVENNSFGDGITQYWLVAGDTLPGPAPGIVLLDGITQDSVFVLELVVENLCGPDVQADSVLVRPYPIVDFGFSTDEGCSPLTIDFANTVLGDPDQFFWDMGNGNTFIDSLPPPQTYSTPEDSISTYTVTLSAANECGADTLQRELTVYPPDVSAFIQLDTLGGCSPLSMQLQQFSTPGSNVSWQIFAPDGSFNGSNLPDPVVTLEQPGLHTIVLYAKGCGEATDTAQVEVLPAPVPAFEAPGQSCLGEEVAFTNLSSGISGSVWDFGDGQGSTANSPVHTYDSAGVYTVSLTVYSVPDNCPATLTQTLTVVGVPSASFTPSEDAGCAPLSVSFDNQSSGLGSLEYVWDFGDGSSASFAEAPTHVYTEPGEYEARLTVIDEQECFSDTSRVNITVHEDPLAAFALSEGAICSDEAFLTPSNLSSGAVAYEWRLFGESQTEVQPELLMPPPGEHELRLIAESDRGCRDTVVEIFTVLSAPEAGFSLSTSEGCAPLRVVFENLSTDADSYSWDFANGNSSTAFSPVSLFAEAGTYEVRLVALSFNGCPNDTASAPVVVRPKPLADFTFDPPENCGAPQQVSFLNLSTGNVNNLWDFGDGSGSEETQVTHTFEQAGLYEVQLLVENEFQCRDTLVQEIDILGRPEAAMQLSVNQGCEPLYVEVENLSEQALQYSWRIETLPEFQVAAPSFTLPQAGRYDLELIAVYNQDCTDTLRLADAITVYERPRADFSYEVDPLEDIIGDVAFFNHSVDADRFLWDLGDGTETTVFEPVHEYSFNADIPVQLTAYNDNGGAFTCEHDTTQLIKPEWITTFFAPNAFSPEYGNGDVRVFKPVGLGMESYAISIYSPYGELVWYSEALENHQPAEAWDGRHKGALLPQGVYTWMAEITYQNGDRRRETGTVTLLR